MEQLTLSFEPGLSRKYRNLRECVAAGIYRRGLQKVAGALDQAPSNLSTALSGDNGRRFGLDELEKYFDEFEDFEPIFYQVERWLHRRTPADKRALMAQATELMDQFRSVVSQMES